jgi:hypothetical protein
MPWQIALSTIFDQKTLYLQHSPYRTLPTVRPQVAAHALQSRTNRSYDYA